MFYMCCLTSDSPFRPLVVDPSKVIVSGGWQPLLDEHDRIPLVVNKEKQIPFVASDAGPGELTADVHGPSYKVPVAIDSRLGGKHTLIFTPKEEGNDIKYFIYCQIQHKMRESFFFVDIYELKLI